MAMTVDLPAVLEEDLREEAEREGVQPSEHAALLLSICTALLNDAQATPFSSAVKEFLSRRSLDSEHLAAAFEELVQQCLTGPVDESTGSAWIGSNLRAWRNSLVHQGVNANLGWAVSVPPRADEATQVMGRVSSDERVAREAVADLLADGIAERRDLSRRFWQAVGEHKARGRISLADCFCIALARRLSADLVTSDRREFEPLAPLGLVTVRFIR